MILHLSAKDIFDVVRRRTLLLFIPWVLITIISIVGAYVLPARYESYTTILIQREEVINPLVHFDMAVTMAQGDALSTLNEIVYGTSTLVLLLDSLGTHREAIEPAGFDEKIEEMRKKISTMQRSSDSFRITFADPDPIMAQRAATVLAQLYIQTTQKATHQQNDEAVTFFERKVAEYGKMFEKQQRNLLSLRQGTLTTLPQGGETAMSVALDKLDAELRDVERVLAEQQQNAALLQEYTDNIDNPGTISQISALETQGAVMYMEELKALSIKYNQLLGRYTPRYPEVQSVRQQLLNLLRKSLEAVNAEIEATRVRKERQQRRRDDLLQSLSKSITQNESSQGRRTDYTMYKEMYDGLKMKLEQARVSRDLGNKGMTRFVILDAAQVPTKPTKPNKRLMIGGGIGVGAVMGILAAFLGEYMDATIRRRVDIERYQKPIIAYLP